MSERDDLLRCSFCGKTYKQVHKLIAGPGVYICDEDVTRAAGLGRAATRDEKCGFCGKTGAQVSWLWQIPDASICNECVGLCNEIIREELRVVEGEERAEVEATVTAEATATTEVAGARCPSCRARLSDTARSQIVDVPAGDGTEGARVLFLYCAGCGLTIDDVMLPDDR